MGSENSLTLTVTGMSCASCAGRVEKALTAVAGVQDAHVNLSNDTVRVSGAQALDASAIAEALQTAGYPAQLQTYRFSVEKMSCGSCVGRVERALAGVEGVVSASVNLASEQATVQVLGTAPDAIASAATAAGYPAQLIVDQDRSEDTADRKAAEAEH